MTYHKISLKWYFLQHTATLFRNCYQKGSFRNTEKTMGVDKRSFFSALLILKICYNKFEHTTNHNNLQCPYDT